MDYADYNALITVLKTCLETGRIDANEVSRVEKLFKVPSRLAYVGQFLNLRQFFTEFFNELTRHLQTTFLPLYNTENQRFLNYFEQNANDDEIDNAMLNLFRNFTSHIDTFSFGIAICHFIASIRRHLTPNIYNEIMVITQEMMTPNLEFVNVAIYFDMYVNFLRKNSLDSPLLGELMGKYQQTILLAPIHLPTEPMAFLKQPRPIMLIPIVPPIMQMPVAPPNSPDLTASPVDLDAI